MHENDISFMKMIFPCMKIILSCMEMKILLQIFHGVILGYALFHTCNSKPCKFWWESYYFPQWKYHFYAWKLHFHAYKLIFMHENFIFMHWNFFFMHGNFIFMHENEISMHEIFITRFFMRETFRTCLFCNLPRKSYTTSGRQVSQFSLENHL